MSHDQDVAMDWKASYTEGSPQASPIRRKLPKKARKADFLTALKIPELDYQSHDLSKNDDFFEEHPDHFFKLRQPSIPPILRSHEGLPTENDSREWQTTLQSKRQTLGNWETTLGVLQSVVDRGRKHSRKHPSDDRDLEAEAERRSRTSPAARSRSSSRGPSPDIPSFASPISSRGRARGRSSPTLRRRSSATALTGNPDPLLETIVEVNTPAVTPSHNRTGLDGNRPALIHGSPSRRHPGANTLTFGDFGPQALGTEGLWAAGSRFVDPPPRFGDFNSRSVMFSTRVGGSSAPTDPASAPATTASKPKAKGGKSRSKSPQKRSAQELDLFVWDPDTEVWSDLEQLSVETQSVMKEFVDDMRTTDKGNTVELYNRALSDPVKQMTKPKHSCMSCQCVGKSAIKCENTTASTTSCPICIDQLRPCVKLIYHPEFDDQEHFALGFYPLAEAERQGFGWEQLNYWVKAEKKARAARTKTKATATAATARPARTSRSPTKPAGA